MAPFRSVLASCFSALVLSLFLSCGIEHYLYLYPVTNIRVDDHTTANFVLPAEQAELDDYFTTYRIFYRIYLSNNHISGIIADPQFASVHPELSRHHARLSAYFNTEENAPHIIVSVFDGLGYYTLEYGGDKRPFFGPGIHGKTVVVDFSVPGGSILSIGNIPYSLERSVSVTDLRPSGNFLLIKNGLSGSDVETNTAGSNYAYVALYILAQGRDDNGSLAFSAPSLIGVFELKK